MSNENNIQNFDNFFRESFGNFQPEPPAGVFEAIQSQIGATSAGSAGVGAQTLAKIAQIGLGKIVTAVVAVATISTVTYLAVDNATADKTGQTPTEQTNESVANTPVQEDAVANSNTDVSKTSNSAGETSAATTHGNQTTAVNNTSSPKNEGGDRGTSQVLGASDGKPNNTVPEKGSTNAENSSSTPTTEANTPQSTKQLIPMYISGAVVCPNDEITVTLADDVSKFRYKVNFGDGSIITSVPGKPITHKYKTPGTYKISANDIANTKTTKEQFIKVSNLHVEFAVENTEKATFKFINNSICDGNIISYNWIFGDDGTSTEKSPTHAYKSFEVSEYKVKLIAVTESGCVDSFATMVKQSYTYEDQKPIIPNVFSPNNDGINDRYDIGIRNEEKYHLVVFDKAGNTVFESFEKENTWDGRNINTGEICPATTYMMVFVYQIKGFAEKKIKGTIDIKR